ncbi:argininosuccinate synthase [Candidatus Vidania fulgoroideorum]
MKIVKKIKNKKLALAYSGGLDTSVAIKWLKKKKVKVYAFYANLGNFKKKKILSIKKKALKLGALMFKSVNCIKKIIQEAFLVLKTRAFCVYCGTGIYYNITPIGRVVTSREIYFLMKKQNIRIWCDGSTYKGNDIERFFNYVYIMDKKIKFFKPWLDKRFIKKLKGRKSLNKFIGKKKKNFSIDSNILGNTYEGEEIEKLKLNILKIKFILCGKIKKIKKKTILSINFNNGNIIKINNKNLNINKIYKLLNKICSKHNLGISDQVEDRIIGTKSRGIYESPAMHLLYNIYDRFISLLYNYDDIKLYRNNGIKLGRLLYCGKWFNKEAKIRKQIGLYYSNKIKGYIKILLIYNNIYFLNTKVKHTKYKKTNSSMEQVKKESFSYLDRIGHINISKINLDT